MMDRNQNQGMRMSLPPGIRVRGGKDVYTVKNFLCMSSRSVTVRCEASDGQSYRLKLYNGRHSVRPAVLGKIAAPGAGEVLPPSDLGVFGDHPFAVYRQLAAADAGRYPIAQDVLVGQIIPRLADMVNRYHRNRILLRDICPEHILYREREKRIAYFGFSNPAVLPDHATVTKEAGYGQHPSYIAPEVPRYGYSICSDYYSLGVTILTLALGRNPMEAMSWEEICRGLARGAVPGIDMEHLRNTPYHLYSEEDRVLYLVLGLMLPNPRNRWGYGELRCWCGRQQIPLVRKGGRIRYQYAEPFLAGGVKCWNARQLARVLAADAASWSEDAFVRLSDFAVRQRDPVWNQILHSCQEENLTASGKIFRCIYGLDPALDGLWWEGKRYEDTGDLIRSARRDPGGRQALSSLLKNRCLSCFLRARGKVSGVKEADIRELEELERWELAEPEKGVSRCMMRFGRPADGRSFQFRGETCRGLDELTARYSARGLELKKASGELLAEKSFQAWLWANGMEEAGAEAIRMAAAHPEQSFYLLMKLAESASGSEEARQTARRLYLTYGDYAPIYWLSRNLDSYRVASFGDQILCDAFREAGLSPDKPLEELSAQARRLVPDYQHFVSRTIADPETARLVELEFSGFSFCPRREDLFFCCTWENGLEVCPAFLNSIGEKSAGS